MTDLVVFQRLLLITFIAGAIGYERERHGRAAGFRTHILVGVGSCLTMLTGLYLAETMPEASRLDPSRMASQVIVGIGFIGAGTILRFRASIRGLTTAASLWAVGCVGLAIGAGFLTGSLATSLILVIALFGLSRFERAMRKEQYQTLIIEMGNSAHDLARVRSVLSEHDIELRDFDVKETDQPNRIRLEMDVKMLADQPRGDILADLLRFDPTIRAHWS